VWWGTPPRSARTTLQTCVLQLRELIGTAPAQREREGEGVVAKDILATVPGGYRLQTRGGTVDHREFERGAGTGCGPWTLGTVRERAAVWQTRRV
jgi:DNA-binding SARP family transcriptional activator